MSRVDELRENAWLARAEPFHEFKSALDQLIKAAREEGKVLGKAEGAAEERAKYYADYLQRRGIEDVSDACERCCGFGYRSYPSTATWRGGVGGQAITSGVCDRCWGSGSKSRPWRSWRAAQPTSTCRKTCAHESPCLLPRDHLPSDRHETEHGCIFFDAQPTSESQVETGRGGVEGHAASSGTGKNVQRKPQLTPEAESGARLGTEEAGVESGLLPVSLPTSESQVETRPRSATVGLGTQIPEHDNVPSGLVSLPTSESRFAEGGVTMPPAGESPAPTTHGLKCWRGPFEAIASGEKRFEWRRDDRKFHVGDTLLLREWDETRQQYTGRECKQRVTYILSGRFGVPDGYAVMSIAPLPTSEPAKAGSCPSCGGDLGLLPHPVCAKSEVCATCNNRRIVERKFEFVPCPDCAGGCAMTPEELDGIDQFNSRYEYREDVHVLVIALRKAWAERQQLLKHLQELGYNTHANRTIEWLKTDLAISENARGATITKLAAAQKVIEAARKWRDNHDAKCPECDYGDEGAGCDCSRQVHEANEGLREMRAALANIDREVGK